MKRIFLLTAMLCIVYITNAQTLSYNDIGVLLAKEKIDGTARFNAMSGAFGALGNDLSAIEINPAGAAVFLKSEFAFSLGMNSTESNATFYGTSILNENDNTNINQAGGVFVFKTNYTQGGWNKFAFAVNYSLLNDFNDAWIARGNSGYAPYTDFYDPDVNYPNSEGHEMENYTDGQNRKYSFTIASQYENDLYVGFSINTYDIEQLQRVLINEFNADDAGNTFDVSLLQELYTFGDGVSFNFGLISKPSDNVRLGVAYQSPIWYSLSEDFIDDGIEVLENNDLVVDENRQVNAFDYKLRTPSKITGSFAYIFDRQGLISIDYTFKNYKNTELRNGDFIYENQQFNSELETVGELRIGTEWRFDNISIRGGYHFEKNPYKNSLDSENIEGFSLGAGFKFRGGKFDLAYQKSDYSKPYNFYPQYDVIENTNLNIDTSKVTATLVLNI
jgi:long-subunit fatty acid transport protein